MKNIKTAEEFRNLPTSIEPNYYTDNSNCKGMYDADSVESLMQQYAEYYYKAKVKAISKEDIKDIIIKNANGLHSNCDISASEILNLINR